MAQKPHGGTKVFAKKNMDSSNNSLADPARNKSDCDDNHFSQLTNEWLIRNRIPTNMNYSEIVEQAASGLEKEGALAGDHHAQMGTKFGEMLRKVKYDDKKTIVSCCIHIYTAESFVYRILNETLRKYDMSKVDTFGPFCYFLNCYPEALGRNYFVGIVYRCVKLDSDTIETYKQAIGQWKSWPAFTTTMKNKMTAEAFGNVLFVIELTPSTRYGKAVDISQLSTFPAEDEVLLLPGSNFRINRMEYSQKGQPVFYLTVV